MTRTTIAPRTTITIRRVLGFCCSSALRRHGHIVWESRDYPYGMTHLAYDAAESEAAARGYIAAPVQEGK